jgi:predicted Holliday junction resolvase-like endonuclease
MLEKLLALKEDKRWLYYLLILPIIILSIYELYNKYLISSSKTIVEETKKTDEILQKEQIKVEQKAKIHEEEAQKIEEHINNTKIDKDWYLK